MTYRTEPTRWTQSPEDAPELLQGALVAATREGPSDLQMRALSLKLAALGAGTAIAAGAASAHASATGAGLAGAAGSGVVGSSVAGATATGGGLSMLAKVAVSLALVGGAATGAVYFNQPSTVSREGVAERQLAQPASPAAGADEITDLAVPTRARPAAQAERAAVEQTEVERTKIRQEPRARVAAQGGALTGEPTLAERAGASAAAAEPSASNTQPSTSSTRVVRARTERRAARSATRSSDAKPSVRTSAAGEPAAMSEIDLLRSARSALAGRPQEAYRLAEQHRSLYPSGVFAQERDALAIEALLRAGNLTLARERAEVFIKRYPSSPHAHRFVETMKLD